MRNVRPLWALLLALALPAAARAAATSPASTPVVTPAGTLTAVEALTSTVLQEGQSSFSGLALRVRFQPPQLMKQFEIMPTIEWWRNSNTIQPYGIETTRKDATLGVDGRWNFGGTTFKPYAGAGFALHFLSNRVSAPILGLNEATDSVTKGGLVMRTAMRRVAFVGDIDLTVSEALRAQGCRVLGVDFLPATAAFLTVPGFSIFPVFDVLFFF